ncbi:MAG: DUF5706 domain-containing protein [Xanthomonadales bacterium]|nr:DUF5706 domain-containing protein [Xanthomonadales bacterium]
MAVKAEALSPLEVPLDSHLGQRHHYLGIVGRNTADYLLQTAQRHHMILSQMADTKANMLLTVSSVVLTISIAQMRDPDLRPALLTLCAFTLAALLMAILAVLPKVRGVQPVDLQSGLPPWFSPVFFGHFSALTPEQFHKMMAEVLRSDAGVYEVLVNDLYGLGSYLAKHKYRYLRWAYLFLLSGFVSATLVMILRLMLYH